MPARGSVDLSSDYRLPTDVFEKTYATKHRAPRKAIFGLPELHPEVAQANWWAIQAAIPRERSWQWPRWPKPAWWSMWFDSKSGISGAGVEPTETSHYPNMSQNVTPYKLTTHRHVPEIKQELSHLSPGIKVNFTPHVIPSVRGILTTAHVFARKGAEETYPGKTQVASIYRKFYKNAPFIRMADSIPRLSSVRGSNFCDISFEAEKGSDRLVVISAIDNLVKGASGQAIQNLNLMAGFDERTGLWIPGMAP